MIRVKYNLSGEACGIKGDALRLLNAGGTANCSIVNSSRDTELVSRDFLLYRKLLLRSDSKVSLPSDTFLLHRRLQLCRLGKELGIWNF